MLSSIGWSVIELLRAFFVQNKFDPFTLHPDNGNKLYTVGCVVRSVFGQYDPGSLIECLIVLREEPDGAGLRNRSLLAPAELYKLSG